MMAAGAFLLLKNISFTRIHSYGVQVLLDVSAKSYGIYLAHIMVLNAVHGWLDHYFTSAAIILPLIALTTFMLTYMVIKLLSYLPKSKWLIG